MYAFVYVCTQVDVLKGDDKDAAAAIDPNVAIPLVLKEGDKDAVAPIDQSVPAPSAFPDSDIVNNVVAKESPSKQPKLEMHAGDIVPEVSSMIGSAAPSKPKTYRSMYYKSGLCLKPCAYIC